MKIQFQTNQFAIRSIIHSNVDCEWGQVKVILDENATYSEIKALYEVIDFVDKIDDTFLEVDEVRVSGELNMIYDPEYFFRVKLYYSEMKDRYSIQIKK